MLSRYEPEMYRLSPVSIFQACTWLVVLSLRTHLQAPPALHRWLCQPDHELDLYQLKQSTPTPPWATMEVRKLFESYWKGIRKLTSTPLRVIIGMVIGDFKRCACLRMTGMSPCYTAYRLCDRWLGSERLIQLCRLFCSFQSAWFQH